MSTLAALAVSSLSLLGLAAGLSALMREKTAKCFPAVAGLIVLVLYAAGLAGILKAGAVFMLALGVAGAIWCAVQSIREKRAPQGLCTMAVCLLGVLAISYYAHAGRLYGVWDEFSHWGLAMRQMRESHSLSRGAGVPLLFMDYPPATALFAYFMGFLAPEFAEDATFVAQNLLTLCVMAPLLSDFSVKKPLSLMSAASLSALLPIIMNADAYSTVYVDSLLGVMTGMALLCFFARDFTRADAAGFASLLFLLTLTKPSGLGLAVIVLAVALCAMLAAKEKQWLTLFGGAGAAAGAKISWNVYMALCGSADSWNLGAINPLRIGETQKEVLLHFMRALEERPLLSYWVPVTYLMGVVIFAFAAWLLVQMIGGDRGGKLKPAFVGAALGSGAYALVMLLLYMYVYSVEEGVGLASYERYMATYLLALWLFLLGVALREGEKVRMRVLVASAAVIFATGDVGKHGYELLKSPISVKINWAYRASYEPLMPIHDLLKDGEKVFIASCVPSPLDWHMARYTAMLPGEAINLPWESGMGVEEAPDAQVWMDQLASDFEYVYMCWQDAAFVEKYGACFEGGVKNHTIYRVDKEARMLFPVE